MPGKSILIFAAVFTILVQGVVIAQPVPVKELLPPHYACIDPASMVVTWSSPGYVVLSEDFEGELFPPENWQATSDGKGWQQLDTILANHWKIPAHDGRYALSNDDNEAPGNSGGMDYLVTPALNLVNYDSLVLRFDSYFDGAYGQSAFLEYSTNNGFSWILLKRMDASLDWEKEVVDLTEISGQGGLSSVIFAFHSDDNGYNGSGWAVDNIEIANSPQDFTPLSYTVLFDNLPVDTTTELFSFIPTIEYTYGDEHIAEVFASYPGGNSDTVFMPFKSRYLFPAYDIYSENCGQKCLGLGWSGPYRPPSCWPWELQSVFPTPDYYWTEGGCEVYDSIIYIVFESTNEIMKMDLYGNFVGMFNVPGVPPLTDIAHDYYDEVFYGVCGTDVVYKMDFETHTLLGQFTAPAPLHAIAYSEEYQRFWGNNISSDIIVFDQYQAYDTFPVGNYGNIHSLAYNDFTYDDANLYAFSRDSTGCLLVAYDGYQGVPTGFTKDLSYLHPGGQAGGVYIDYAYPTGCAMIGGTIQNELVFRYSLEEHHFPGWTPEGIWGYYIYEDEEVFDSVEIMCDKWLVWIWYPEDTLPQSHQFSVSVKYELDMFGMEGQIAFSEKDGPVEAGFTYGHELDFEEKWTSQNFNYRKWDTIGPRWEINTTLGNPAPSACVRGINGIGPYSCTLQSYVFRPDSIESCGISLAYDLRVFDNFPSGNQTMQVDLWDAGSRSWQKLREYHNDTVWNGFFTESIDITNKVKDRCFMIRFVAYGTDVSDIQFWSLDNISVKRSCPPPVDLMAEYDDGTETISLDWTSYFPEINQWIHYDDSIQNTSVGLGTGPDTWCDAAIRWDKFSLDDYHNASIKRLAFIPSDPETHYILKIWTGDSAKVLRAQKAVADLEIDQWNVIDLDEAVMIDGVKELWIGYSFSGKGSDPISMDAGPAQDSLGNMCRIGGGDWTTFSDISPEMNGNIIIQALIQKPEQHPAAYRLYKSVNSDPYQYLTEVSSSEYYDTGVTLNLMHCYKLQSVCASSPDTIYSVFSTESCVIPVNVGEISHDHSNLVIFPNPAGQIITIQAPESMTQIEILDITGQSILNCTAGSNKVLIELSSLKPGIYIIAATTKSSSYFKKVIVSK